MYKQPLSQTTRMMLALGLSILITVTTVAGPGWSVMMGDATPGRRMETSLFVQDAFMPTLVASVIPLSRAAKTHFAQLALQWAPAVFNFLPYVGAFDANAIHGVAAAIPPLFPSRLDRMKRSFEDIRLDHNMWESITTFLSRYFGSAILKQFQSDVGEARELLSNEDDDRQFLLWLASVRQESPDLRAAADILDIQLAALRYPGSLRDPRAAIDDLKQMGARRELLHVALSSSGNYACMAAAIDALQDLHAIEELQEIHFSDKLRHMMPPRRRSASRNDSRKEIEVASVPAVLPILARYNVPELRQYFTEDWLKDIPSDPQHPRSALDEWQARLRLPDRKTTVTAFRLMALHYVPRPEIRALLFALINENDRKKTAEESSTIARPGDIDVYVSVTMLAILQLVWQSGAGRVSLNPSRVQALQKEITSTLWSAPEYDLARSVTVTKIAGRLGEMVHRHPDTPAIQTMLGIQFEMVFRESLRLLNEDLLPHPAVYPAEWALVAAAQSPEIEDPKVAARLQFSVLVHAAMAQGVRLPWPRIYKFALWLLALPGSYSLSQLAREIKINFLPQEQSSLDYLASSVRERSEDLKRRKWRIFYPESMAAASRRTRSALIPPLNQPWDDRTADEILGEFVNNFLPVLWSDENYSFVPKYRIFTDRWTDLTKIILGQKPERPIYPYQLEIDPTEHCSMDCIMCRITDEVSGLRDVPEHEVQLSAQSMISMVDEAFEANPDVEIRISGTIGEPLLNRATLLLMRHMNERGIAYNLITNGFVSEERWKEALDVMFAPHSMMVAISVSVYADSNETSLRMNKPKGKDRLRAADRVKENVAELVKRWKASGMAHHISTSTVVTEINAPEIEALANSLKAIGVPMFQIKMPLSDPRMHMGTSSIATLYARKSVIDGIKDDHFKVVFLQDEETAHLKNEGQSRPAPGISALVFHKDGKPAASTPEFVSMIPRDIRVCLAQIVSPAISATGEFHSCCVNFVTAGIRRTLPSLGRFEVGKYKELIAKRAVLLTALNPQGICLDCAPTDGFMNALFRLMQSAARFPGLLTEMGRIVEDRRSLGLRLKSVDDERHQSSTLRSAA